MNLGLRCGQLMAERNKGLNIIERTALWYRLERIGKSPEPEPQPILIPPSRDMVLQIKAEVVGWREKHSKLLLEVDTLKKMASKGSQENYTIEGDVSNVSIVDRCL